MKVEKNFPMLYFFLAKSFFLVGFSCEKCLFMGEEKKKEVSKNCSFFFFFLVFQNSKSVDFSIAVFLDLSMLLI